MTNQDFPRKIICDFPWGERCIARSAMILLKKWSHFLVLTVECSPSLAPDVSVCRRQNWQTGRETLLASGSGPNLLLLEKRDRLHHLKWPIRAFSPSVLLFVCYFLSVPICGQTFSSRLVFTFFSNPSICPSWRKGYSCVTCNRKYPTPSVVSAATPV